MKRERHSLEKINFLLNIVENLYEKRYKLDNFREILENLISLLDLKFILLVRENIGYYIDNEKYFFISNQQKLLKYKTFLKKLLKDKNMLIVNNCDKNYKIFKNLGNEDYPYHFFFIKLSSELYIIGAREVPFSQKDITLISRIKALIKKSLEQDEVENQLLTQAYTDPLTELYNRRFFEKIVPIEIERAKRYKYPVSIIYLDIDNFKRVNDVYGHYIGDIFLRHFGTLVKEVLRKADIPIRIGGDEFIIFLPFTRKKDAENLAYKIRKIVKDNLDLLCEGKDCSFIDISFGILELDKFDTIETVLSKADFLMYQAKKQKKIQFIK
jgi:diguanylate cyclase (GGDEF)-like protein